MAKKSPGKQSPTIAAAKYVIAVGASAGGLEALQELLYHFPEELEDMAIVIAQHLGSKHKSLLPQLLQKETTLKVEEVEDQVTIQAGRVYIGPSAMDMSIVDKKFHLTKPLTAAGPKPSINRLFHSLAEGYQQRSVGIILSGTGTDGALGVVALQEAGAFTIAQDPLNAKFDGMPRAAIDTGSVELVTVPSNMGKDIVHFLLKGRRKKAAAGNKQITENTRYQILQLLSQHSGTEFIHYKSNTVERRLWKRISALKINTAEKYLQYLNEHPEELEELFKIMLISVTDFFRDKEAFRLLRTTLQQILRKKSPGDSIRIWVAGCATGEEAYSVAILLSELLKERKDLYTVQIFATDIDENAISIARKGVYEAHQLKDVPKELSDKYFVATDNTFTLTKEIKSMILFSRHDVTRNAPFLNLDMVSCRNLLIYFDQVLQQQVLPLFHYSLLPDAYLFLGKSESIGKFQDLFNTVDDRFKLYQRKPGNTYKASRLPIYRLPAKTGKAPVEKKGSLTVLEMVKETLFQTYEHPYVVINADWDVLEVFGDMQACLSIQEGEMTRQLLKLVHKNLQVDLRTIITRCFKEQKQVRSAIKRFEWMGQGQQVRMIARPILAEQANRKMIVLIFEKILADEEIAEGKPISAKSEQARRLAELEEELLLARENLQLYIEEMETANEEMQSLNEELQSSNEELQSTNEELETANEELQSTSEEVQITYSELRITHAELEKREELLRTSEASMQALFSNTLQAFFHVDPTYKIISFNKRAAAMMMTLHGREIRQGDSMIDLLDPEGVGEFVQEYSRALKGQVVNGEASIRTKDGQQHWYIYNYTPVVTNKDEVIGVSISVLDISADKNIAQALHHTEKILSAVFDATSIGVAVTNDNGEFVDVNAEFCRLYGYDREELIGQSHVSLLPDIFRESARQWHKEFMSGNQKTVLEGKAQRKNGEEFDIYASSQMLVLENDRHLRVTSVTDISLQKASSIHIQRSEQKYRSIVDNSIHSFLLTGADGSILDANKAACLLFGYSLNEFRYLNRNDIVSPDNFKQQHSIESVNYLPGRGELLCIKKNGQQFWVEYSSVSFRDIDGQERNSTMIVDISERREKEEAVRKAKNDMEMILDNTEQSFLVMDRNLRIVTFNKKAQSEAMYILGKPFVIGQSVIDLAFEDRKEVLRKMYAEILEGHPKVYEFDFKSEEGVRLQFELKYTPVTNSEGVVDYIMLNSRDITKENTLKHELKQSEAQFRGAFEYSAVGMAMVSLEGKWMEVNASICSMLGYSKKELKRLTFQDITYPDDLELDLRNLASLIKRKIQSYNLVKRYIHKNGSIVWGALSVTLVEDVNGQPLHLIAQVQDITEKRKNEELLIANEVRYRALVDNGADAVVILTDEGKPVYVSPAIKRVLGYTVEEAQSLDLFSLTHPDDIEKVTEAWMLALENPGMPVPGHISRLLHKDGSWRWFEDTMTNMLHDPNIGGIVDNFRDVTAKVLADMELQQSRASLQKIMDSSQDIICSFDEAGRFVQVSQACKSVLGYQPEDLLGKFYMDLVYGEDVPLTIETSKAIMSGMPVTNFENRYMRKDGSVVPMIWSARWEEREKIMYCIARDGSEKVRAEQEKEFERRNKEALINTTEDFIWSVSRDLKLIAGNKAFVEVVKNSTSKIIQPGDDLIMENIFPGTDSRLWKDLYKQALTGHVFKYELHANPDERLPEFWSEITFNPIYDDLEVIGIACYAQDITGKKKAELELIRFKQVIESSHEGIGLLSNRGEVIFVNQAFSNLLGHSADSLRQTGNPLSIYVNADMALHITNKLLSGEHWSGDLGLYNSKGEIVDCYLSAGPVFNERKEMIAIYGIHTDINDRKNLERKLVEYNTRFTTILESITDGFYSVDKDWTVTYWNKEAEKLLGQKRGNIVGNNLWEYYPVAIPVRFYKEYHRAIQENISVHFEEYAESVERWFDISAYPSENGLSVYFKDVTERKRVEEAIRLSNERYDLVAKASKDSIWDWDFKTNTVIRPGNRLENIYGFDTWEENEVDEKWNIHAHPEDWEAVNRRRDAILKNPAMNYWEDEYRFLTSDNKYAYVYDRGYILRNEQGEAVRMIGASRDITKDKEQVNEIIRIQQNLDSLINTTNDLIWSIDNDLKIITFNKAYAGFILAMTGREIKEGSYVFEEDGDIELRKIWRELYDRALEGESFQVEQSIRHPLTGHLMHGIISFSPILDKNGLVSGFACYAKDVTALKNSEEKLKELNSVLQVRAEELVSSNAELERFAYVASHDLQEPLRMVSSFLQLLEKKYRDQLDETANQYIHFAVDGADRMKQLIKDLLEYSRVGTNKEIPIDTDMQEVLHEVVETFETKIRETQAKLLVHPMPVIRAGKVQMVQLVQNLVSNAFKYNTSPSPEIEIGFEDKPDYWQFYVKDNGIGIEPKFFDKVFIIFQRLHNKNQFSGTGIGLAICKKIVERHGGNIWIDSAIGQGSKFYFSIKK